MHSTQKQALTSAAKTFNELPGVGRSLGGANIRPDNFLTCEFWRVNTYNGGTHGWQFEYVIESGKLVGPLKCDGRLIVVPLSDEDRREWKTKDQWRCVYEMGRQHFEIIMACSDSLTIAGAVNTCLMKLSGTRCKHRGIMRTHAESIRHKITGGT